MKHPTEEKIFKLLADPQKLKKTKQKPKDQLQIEIESKFHYSLSNTLYLDILRVIKEELVLDTILNEIIHKAIQGETTTHQNPSLSEDVLIKALILPPSPESLPDESNTNTPETQM